MPTLDAPVQNIAEGAYQQAWQPFLENFGGGLSPEMKELGKRIGERVIKLQQSFADEPVTINHGDFRMDNLFFHDFTDGAALAVADWQISTRGRGIFDVSYLLCGGMEPALRAEHERDLLRIYTDVLAEHGVKGYGFDKAWEEYRRGALFMWVYVVIAIGTLDASNERGLALFLAWLNRAVAAAEHLKAAELLPE
jgi:aminoglycoside phosphotransferase (APT) family kinase protein